MVWNVSSPNVEVCHARCQAHISCSLYNFRMPDVCTLFTLFEPTKFAVHFENEPGSLSGVSLCGCIRMREKFVGGTTEVVLKRAIDSAEKCQSFCQLEPECQYFQYTSKAHPVNKFREECQLLTSNDEALATKKSGQFHLTGPKNCGDENDQKLPEEIWVSLTSRSIGSSEFVTLLLSKR